MKRLKINKTEILALRITKEEKKILCDLATDDNRSLSKYVRSLIKDRLSSLDDQA